MKTEIAKYLMNIGFKPQTIGFDYWTEALNLTLSDKKYRRTIYKELIPTLASCFNKSNSAIQSGLRATLRNSPLKTYTVYQFLNETILKLEELCK